MAVHVEELTTELAVMDGNLPLSEAQLERLVDLVARRLAERERAARHFRRQTVLRPSAEPPAGREA
jgi:hypothetical protein